ncbi:MAG TPA: dihydrofolate reductase family protein [Acidimicrobiales bacterium]
MRKLFSFVITSLDGYHVGPDGEFDWPNVDEEFHEFSIRQLNDIDTLLFGRVTYEHMAQFWPTAEARQTLPVTAGRMNSLHKVVFSSTLKEATWENSVLVTTDPVAKIDELKRRPGEGDLALFGSSTLTASLVTAGAVDELRVMVNPILLGGGVSLFTGLDDRVKLRLGRSITFRNGNVLLCYTPDAP